MKDIDRDVWVKFTIKQVNKVDSAIIDDLRFMNEYNYLKQNGFIIIRLDIDNNTQEDRLRIKYGDSYTKHLEGRNHNSEQDIDQIPADLVVYSDENAYEKIIEYLSFNR